MPKGPVEVRQCRFCTKNFETTDKRKVYCSIPCHWNWQNAQRKTSQEVERNCDGCGKPFKPRQVRGVGRSWCSTNCRKSIKRVKQTEYRAGPYQQAGGTVAWRLKRYYGITLDEYNAMLAAQGGVCWLCGKTETTETKRGSKKHRLLCVDHCHEKGHVRKLLCVKCNIGLGSFGDSPDLLRKAIDYLEKHR